MKNLYILALMVISLSAYSQNKELAYLWPGKVPGEPKEKKAPVIDAPRNDGVLRYSEVTNPALEIWPAGGNNNRAAIIVCPGGGYRILAYDKEGTEIAAWLNKLGYNVFVLQYRIPEKREGALQDAQRAIRYVRMNAAKWDIDTDKTGILGFSAGGSLSARASTMFTKKTYSPVDKADTLSCRPSFAMLIYPAYLDQGPANSLTPELELTKETPPVFIFQTADDQHGNSALVMASAMRNAKLPVEIHLMPIGGHGYGVRPGNDAAETWPLLAEEWLTRLLFPKQK